MLAKRLNQEQTLRREILARELALNLFAVKSFEGNGATTLSMNTLGGLLLALLPQQAGRAGPIPPSLFTAWCLSVKNPVSRLNPLLLEEKMQQNKNDSSQLKDSLKRKLS